REEQRGKKLPLWLTEPGYLLQDVVNNCHKPLTGSRGSGIRSPHLTSSRLRLFSPFAQKMSEVLRTRGSVKSTFDTRVAPRLSCCLTNCPFTRNSIRATPLSLAAAPSNCTRSCVTCCVSERETIAMTGGGRLTTLLAALVAGLGEKGWSVAGGDPADGGV